MRTVRCLAVAGAAVTLVMSMCGVDAPAGAQPDRPRAHTSGAVQGRASQHRPAITHVSPGHGGRNGGRTVTVKGRHLSGATKVTFGRAKGTHVRVRSDSKLTVTSPKHAPGYVDVRVTTSAGRSPVRKADRYLFTAVTWASVAQGDEFTCGLRTDKTLWCWGYGASSELGLGNTDDRFVPTLVGTKHWRQIATGNDHACGITTAGALFCWGDNSHGQLGLGDHSMRSRTTKVGTQKWVQVDTGDTNTCAVRQDSTLWCWGDNSYGQLGTGDKSERTVPTKVGSASDWAQVSAGEIHGCAVRSDGSLWCWGDGTRGATGQGFPVDVATSPVRVGSGNAWVDVSAGEANTCGRQSNATLWCWGQNSNGELGVGDFDDRGTPVRVGSGTWGTAEVDRDEPCAIDPSQGLWCWGYPGVNQLMSSASGFNPVHVGTKKWRTVSSGLYSRCAVQSDRSLWCWGYNYHGQLGNGDDTDQSSFVRVVTR